MDEWTEREKDFLKACEALRDSFQKVNETICRTCIETFKEAGISAYEFAQSLDLYALKASPYPECDDCHIIIKDYYYTSEKRNLTVCRVCFDIRNKKGVGHEV